ncbi:LAMI_0F05732g1_1 [Lachancea mirantina]|uniref:LAMI_0F05732g1_1 n=1 Tax=Lachancea mirantina TaxID=1230905 RepID=A0A1G4JYF6_9SACH|nr:LAMI_0F05732g1_1 [Lachancea mirantina]
MNTPETPEHTGANQELSIDDVGQLDDQDLLDVDLDASQGYLNEPSGNAKRAVQDEQNSKLVYDDRDDFLPRVNISSPFSSQVNVQRAYGETREPVRQTRRLSSSQQSKFIAYCDDKLMEIQRKFVQSRGLTDGNGYSGLGPLLEDLKSVLDFVWFSVDGRGHTETLIEQKLENMSPEQFQDSNSTDFGQKYYILRVADDLLDYLVKFELANLSPDEQHSTLSKVFKFLVILDKMLARLLEGLVPGRKKVTGTEMVRISGIAERTRVAVPLFLGQQGIHGYHFEVSRIYEETLERCM